MPISSSPRARGGVHPGQVASPSQGNTQTTMHTLIHTPKGNLERPINLTGMSLDCERKPEYPPMCSRMGTFVTLTEVLEARGSPLEEDEVWCLLLATTDALLDISKKGPGNMCSVLSPGSVLLSGNGSLAFKSCARSEDVASYTAPEAQQGHAPSTRAAAEKIVVYSLGMTLYWCADYHLPQNQPVQISTELEGLLLSMCEDMVVRRTDLLTVLETCEFHHKTSMLPSPERLIRQLVEDVYRNSADHVSMAENGSQLTDRSQMVRDRLH
ncbi:hypothetical protein ILYODFUR_023645, partial [Ilyodon furcidens]